jgi:hypothetical protein
MSYRRFICLRACFKINESKQTVSKLFSPESSGIFRRSLRILLPEPALVANLYGFVNNAGW